MAYPANTGQLLETKSTTKDRTTNTSQVFNGSDWNTMRGHVHALMRQYVGSYRGWVSRRSVTTNTAVTVHTMNILANGRRKQLFASQVLLPKTAGVYYVYVRANTGAAAAAVRTAAAEPAPYATATNDFPLATCSVVTSVTNLTITHIRPDWIIGGGI